MSHSRSGRPKKPGTVARHSAVVSSFFGTVVERWTSQPSTKNHATPWAWKRRLSFTQSSRTTSEMPEQRQREAVGEALLEASHRPDGQQQGGQQEQLHHDLDEPVVPATVEVRRRGRGSRSRGRASAGRSRRRAAMQTPTKAITGTARRAIERTAPATRSPGRSMENRKRLAL